MMIKTMLMAAAIAGCVLIAAGDTVDVGGIEILDEAAQFTHISNDVCELYDPAMADKPIDWEKTEAAYTEEHELNGYTYSLQSLAQHGVEVFDLPTGEHWDEFVTFYGDEEWMDTFIEDAISGDTSSAPDDVRKVYVQKEVRDGVMISMMLSFLDDAHDELMSHSGDLEETLNAALVDWESAWAVYHGSDEDLDNGLNTSVKCSPLGTAERKAEDFGKDDDVNEVIMADIIAGQQIIEGIESEDDLEEAAQELEALTEQIIEAIIVTYLRSAVRYAYRMDGGAAREVAAHEFDDLESLKGSGLSYAQKAQAEGYIFSLVVLPLVAEKDPEAAEYLMDVFSGYPETEEELLDDYVRVTPGVLEAVGSALSAFDISEDDFGVYDSDREATD